MKASVSVQSVLCKGKENGERKNGSEPFTGTVYKWVINNQKQIAHWSLRMLMLSSVWLPGGLRLEHTNVTFLVL